MHARQRRRAPEPVPVLLCLKALQTFAMQDLIRHDTSAELLTAADRTCHLRGAAKNSPTVPVSRRRVLRPGRLKALRAQSYLSFHEGVRLDSPDLCAFVAGRSLLRFIPERLIST
jgi:hypothetical protein